MQSLLSLILEERALAAWIFLGGNALLDLKKREVSLVSCGMALLYGLGGAALQGEIRLRICMLIFLSLFTFSLSKLLGDGIGWGDLWILMGLAVLVHPEIFLRTVLLACLLVGIFVLFLLPFGKNIRSLPFVPFLFAAFSVQLLLGGG